MATAEERFLLKEYLFNQEKVAQIASEIHSVYAVFDTKAFILKTVQGFPERELMQRLYWVRECLRAFLPEDFREAVAILLEALPPPNNPTFTDGDFGDFIYGPYSNYVSEYGCTSENVDFSLVALREMTKRFSVEFPIRSFINTFPTKTLEALKSWSTDPNYHVRRLVSEGTRPNLPWARRITVDYTTPLQFLDSLYSDRTRYVTRSVANHLNDIAKKDPELVLNTLKRWQREEKQNTKEFEFITRHALRSLVKVGHPGALQLLGYAPVALTVSKVKLATSEIKLGNRLVFSCVIQSKSSQSQKLLIDYVLYFKKADGTLAHKTFKIKQITLSPNEKISIEKSHRLVRMTTKKLYFGEQQLQLQINGKKYDKVAFNLVE